MHNIRPIRLGDVISVEHGFAFAGRFFSDNRGFPTLITPGNFQIGGGFKASNPPKTFSGEYQESYILHPGDLIITMTDLSKSGDTLGFPALVPDDGVTYLHNQRIGRVRITDPSAVDREFLNYYLRTTPYRQFILSTASGSTVRHTSPKRIASFVAELPSLDVQIAISQVLGALDDKVAANSNLITTSEQLMSTSVGFSVPRIRLSEVVEQFRTSRSPADFQDESVWHYSLPAFDDGRRPVSDASRDIKSAKFILNGPCVLISKLNPRFPRVWDIPKPRDGESVASTEFVVLKPTACSTSVLWALLSQREFGSVLQGKVAGTSGSHQRVKPADLLATEIADPRSISSEVQQQVTALGALVEHTRDESEMLRNMRDVLLPHLMSGKLRVRDAVKEVEAVV